MSARLIELGNGTLVGRFRVVCEVGRGGHGVVYEAHDTLLGRPVALKTLAVGNLTDEQIMTAEREASLLSKVDSPFVSAIYDLVHHGDAAILVMELVQGATIAAKVQAGPVPWQQVAELGSQLARGLQALHAAGIVHRDIKPSNLRLSRSGLLKILDLGVAGWVPGPNDLTHTDDTGRTVKGTIPYMSPEQLRGARGDVRSDIYACGAVLYELATGRRVFDAGPIAFAMRTLPVRSRPRTLVPSIPPWMERVILRTLDVDPEQRWQSARDLALALVSGRSGRMMSAVGCADGGVPMAVPAAEFSARTSMLDHSRR